MPIVVLTAKEARAITNDIFNNRIGAEIPSIARKITEAAQAGKGSICVSFPTEWIDEQKRALAKFFASLDYTVEYTHCYLSIKW